MKGYKALLDEERYAQVAHDALHVIKERYSTQAFLSKMNKNWEEIARQVSR